MNGDGVEELIVGAPLFVNTMETAAGNTLVSEKHVVQDIISINHKSKRTQYFINLNRRLL